MTRNELLAMLNNKKSKVTTVTAGSYNAYVITEPQGRVTYILPESNFSNDSDYSMEIIYKGDWFKDRNRPEGKGKDLLPPEMVYLHLTPIDRKKAPEIKVYPGFKNIPGTNARISYIRRKAAGEEPVEAPKNWDENEKYGFNKVKLPLNIMQAICAEMFPNVTFENPNFSVENRPDAFS